MTNIYESEKLNSIRNEMTHLWGSVFIVGGGAITLLIHGELILHYLCGFFGLLVAIMLLNAYFVRRNDVVKIVKSLEEK